ncbi:phosphate signaling complex protein PhoU [Paenibacillus filicis]|uniref:Phosphate-specific transport system accessory protein PhoU n=1 Tax=Paenibacillus filicis TaxID=669464 RepID=A0ABU9DG87_9BACL
MDNRINYHQTIQKLQEDLLVLAKLTEEAIQQAVGALVHHNEQTAKQIIEKDDVIDQLTLELEEDGLRLIALQQPMAGDLRIISMAIKMATDLERIADHAVDIAKICLRIGSQEHVKPLVDIPKMAELTIEMLRESLIAYTEKDVHRASSLAEKDDQVDRLYSEIVNELHLLMGSELVRNRQITQLILAAHFLERVADHTTNIGEGVIYMVTGKRKDLNI